MSNSFDLGAAALPFPSDPAPPGKASWARWLIKTVVDPWRGVKPTAYLLLATTLLCPVALLVLWFAEIRQVMSHHRAAIHVGDETLQAGLSVFLIIGTCSIVFALLGVFSQVGSRSLLVRLGAWLIAFLTLLLAFIDNLDVADHAKGYHDLGNYLAVGGLLACLVLPLATLPAFRRLFGAPPASGQVDGIAAAMIVSLTMMSLVPLVCLGRPPMEIETGNHSGVMDAPGIEWISDLALVCWTLVVAPLLVGYGIRRDARQTLERLGLTGFTWRHVGIGLSAMVFMLGIGMVTDMVVHQIWPRFGWPVTNEEFMDKLFAPNFTLFGALAGGATAGITEEILTRGVLQPRLGILLSNVFWVSLHAHQYNWDGLLGVFVTGLLLGHLRKRTNTLCCIIAHGGFDIVLFLSPQN